MLSSSRQYSDYKDIVNRVLRTKVLHYIFRTFNPKGFIFSIDLTICTVSIVLSFLLRFNFNLDRINVDVLIHAAIIVLIIRTITFQFGKTYIGIVRFTSIWDIFRIMSTILIGSFIILVISIIANYIKAESFVIHLSIIIIDAFTSIVLLTLTRLLVKVIYLEYNQKPFPVLNVLIYGSDEYAILTKKALELDRQNTYNLIAFIDQTVRNTGKKLEGAHIFAVDQLERLILKYRVNKFIFGSNKISSGIKSEIIDICLHNHVKVFTVSNIQNWIKGNINYKQITGIKIEDLLTRDPIVLSNEKMWDDIADKTILITGAAGSIGGEIARQICSFPFKQLILVDQAETPMYSLEMELNGMQIIRPIHYFIADITCYERIEKIFLQFKPDYVIHAAAYKHVPLMEKNVFEAVRNNVIGSKYLADLASKHYVTKFVFISTDKAVNPTNVMGASKRIAEKYIQAISKVSGTHFIVTRFGNVLGSNGSVIPLFKQQIERGGPITITHPEVTRFFMTISEACQLVLEASTMGKGGEVFIFDMGKSVKIVDLARNMIRLVGLEPGEDIEIKYVGLRPGEKLYEELLYQSENVLPTHHPKIHIAKLKNELFEEMSMNIRSLEFALKSKDNFDLVKIMKKMVPEFVSQNSIFEQLDDINKNILNYE